MPNTPIRSLDLAALHPQSAANESATRRPVRLEETPANPASAPMVEAEAQRLRAALEDVVTLAHSSATATQRVVQMQRRAIAALSGLDPRQ